MEKGASISECGRYRYLLWRIWDREKPFISFIGLNPSTANAKKDDPTIRRCIGFAERWGYGGLYMVNLFAWRATNPKHMMSVEKPIGPLSDEYIKVAIENSELMIAAWGVNGQHRNRAEAVKKMIPNLKALKINKRGEPAHPLYIPYCDKDRLIPIC